jgi:2-polyprenyl-3-methyl-5-hydroxy-6-metoxy-1,4-benzoquinol methylase
MVKNIVEKANRRIVIGAYNSKPEYNSTITHFYNGILDELKKYDKFNEVGIVAKYRDVSVLVASKHEKKHDRDIDSEKINTAFTQVKRPDLLQYIVDVSRENLGFYTSHYPRVFEYTWLLEQLENKIEGTVLDIGAGVCPLPFCLSEQGIKVITVDSHSKNRTIEDRNGWNEWGFLDYGLFNKKIHSYNEDFLKFKTDELLDCIYSISVIEHIPRKGRMKLVKKAAKLLKKGGKLLLTIDLIPNTNNLWNLSEDKEVESVEVHGNIESFKKELKNSGFEVLEEEIQRSIMDSRTDVYYIKAVLKKKNKFFKLFN